MLRKTQGSKMTNSPVRWLTDEEYVLSPVAERLVAWADSQVGVKESPRGSNDGPKIREYLNTVGLGGGYPWCSAFVKWCASQAGAKSEMLRRITGMANSWLNVGSSHSSPERGYIFVFARSKSGSGHCGICLSKAVIGVFRTIEGNSNDDGSRDGYKVVKRFRTVKSVTKNPVWGFIDIS